MRKYKLNILLLSILVIGLILSGDLVYRDYVYGDICPKVGEFPVCYLVLFYFIILFVIQLLKKGTILFLLFAGFALALAIFASIGELFGELECPKTSLGFPLCFISFILFLSLVLLKFIEDKADKK